MAFIPEGKSRLKNNVKAATTASITLSGPQTIDTVSIVAGDRVLVKNQGTAADNGIYVAAAGAWSRSDDANQNIDLLSGTLIWVQVGGAANGSKLFALETADPIVVGTTALSFDAFSSAIGDAVGGGTVGSVLFIGAGPVLTQDNANFFWDDANNRLGIGTATPSAKLDVDNGATAVSIFVARDNGAPVFTVIDGGALEVAEIAAPATPASGFGRVYEKTDGLLYFKNDAGTEYDLTATGAGMAIGGSVTSATAGSVLFAGAAGVLAQDNANFFWDDTNNRLGIGTAAPTADVHVSRNVNDFPGFWVQNPNGGTSAGAQFVAQGSGSKYASMAYMGVSYSDGTIIPADAAVFAAGSGAANGLALATWFSGGAPIRFITNNVLRLYMDGGTGFFGFGTATPASVAHVDSNAANTTAILTIENTAGDFQIFRTDATPESSVTGSIGDLANDTTGGLLYYKKTGTATNTGWASLPTVASGVATQVAFFDSATNIVSDVGLVYDNTNNRLGIVAPGLTRSPATLLNLFGTTTAPSVVRLLQESSGAGGPYSRYEAYAEGGSLSSPSILVGAYGSTVGGTFLGQSIANTLAVSAAGGAALFMSFGTTENIPVLFGQFDIERLRLGTTEAVFNDPGNDYDFRVEGSGTRPNLLLVDAGTARVGINRAAGTHGATFDVDNLAVAESIFIARDNGTAVVTIADADDVVHAPTARTSGSPTLQLLTGPAHTTLTASTEASDIVWGLSRTVQFSTGAKSIQRAVRLEAPTYAFVGASTITHAATLAISGPPAPGTNATITNAYSIWVESGTVRFDGSIWANGSAEAYGTNSFVTQAGNNDLTVGTKAATGTATLNVVVDPDSTSEPKIQLLADGGTGLATLTLTPTTGNNARIDVGGTGQHMVLNGTSGNMIWANSALANVDFRVSGDVITDLLYTDASTDSVGVRTATPLSALDVNASLGLNVTSVSANTTLDITHHTVLVDASGAARTITLPAASSVTRRRYEIKKTDSSANTVTVDADGAETIDGAATFVLVTQYDSVTIVCDGTSWYVI